MLYGLKIATRYLTASKAQTALLVLGVAVGVFIFVFMSALIGGLAEFILSRTVGDISHITIEADDPDPPLLNVFRYVQAGAEVSSLLGRLPSRVGYQPTLATEVAGLQERIASVAGAAVTSIQAVYVPADDFTDPAVTTISGHMDCVIVLSRALAGQGFYPAIDPLASSSTLLDPALVGADHHAIAGEVRETLARFAELQDIISLLGIDELGAADKRIVARARRLQRFLTQPFAVTEAFTGMPGKMVARADTLAGCRAILDGAADDWDESALYMVGTLDEARAKQAAA